MFKIDEVNLEIIKDSRREDTLKAIMKSDEFEVSSSIPHGKSRGEREAYLVDASTALKNFQKIKSLILEKSFKSLRDFDQFLLKIDGTDNKKNLGGNLILVLSQTFARLISKIKGLELWQYLRQELINLAPELEDFFIEQSSPYFLFNLINGGQHAPYGPKIQEYLLIPKIRDPKASLELAQQFFSSLKEYFLKTDKKINFGDEGGLLITEDNYAKPLEIFSTISKELNIEEMVGFSLDIAASSFYNVKTKKYELSFLKHYSVEELRQLYEELNEKYHFVSLEDPFEQNDWYNFQQLTSLFNKKTIIIGDDLTVTNHKLLFKAIKEKAISGVIIKPTQIGTITETLKTIILAHRHQLKIIVSHRSAETLDDFIADLAVASKAWGLKSGAPQTEERMVKYKRVISIINK